MMNGFSFSWTERGPRHGPWAHKGKSALSSIQIIRSISADLLPYPQSDISCESHLKQLMKTILYVKLHFIQFSSGLKLTLKMFCLSEHFPLGAWWCIILPEGFMAGLHKANIFSPYFISPWQTQVLSHLIIEPAWHIQRVKYSGGVWLKGKNALNSQSYLSRRWHQGN